MKNEIFIDGLTGLFLDYLIQLLLDLASTHEIKPLSDLANDISQNPQNVSSMDSDLVDRIQPLVSGIEPDLNSPLSDEDD